MKVIRYFLPLLFLLVSCGQGTVENGRKNEDLVDSTSSEVNAKDIEIITGEYSLNLNGKSSHDPAEDNFRIRYSFFKAKEGLLEDYQKKLNELIVKTIGNEGLSEIKLKDGNELSENTFEKHIKKVQSEYKRALKEDSDMLDWSVDQFVEIDTSYKDFVQLKVGMDGFFGGAHGMAKLSYNLVDKETANEMKLEDVFRNLKKLELIGEDYFRVQNGMDQEINFDEAGFWFENGFKLNNNFYFTDNKVVFQYNQYEVVPYVRGMPSVELPITKVKELLKISLDKYTSK